MRRLIRRSVTALVVSLWPLALGPWSVYAAQQASPSFKGRPVADVLQELQTAKLRIIFSSDLVPATLLVKDEPKGKDPQDIARQILAPHGLTLRAGPRETMLVVALPKAPARPPSTPAQGQPPAPARPATPESARPPDELRIEERVDVSGRLPGPGGRPAVYTIAAPDVRETAGAFEDVFKTLQVLPGVAPVNDEDGRLAVRGGGPEHNIVLLDGVQIHNPYRFGELTSSFLNPATVSRVSLDASGLDARYGGRLSSATLIETRDGVRDRRLAMTGSLGVASGDLLLEGRLPGTETGSWWATARGTYYRYAAGIINRGDMPGFGDLQFKVSLQPSPRTTLAAFALLGRETMQRTERDDHGDEFPTARYQGDNRIGFVNFSWMPSSRFNTTTTASIYSHDAADYDGFYFFGLPSGQPPFERVIGIDDLAIRQRGVVAMTPRHVLDTGVEIHRLRSSWRLAGVKPPIFWRGIGPSTWGELIEYPPGGAIDSRLERTQVGFWVQDSLPIGSRFTVDPGVRLDWNSFTEEAAWQPRLRVTGRVRGTTLWAGYAAQAQTPSHESLQGFDYFQLPEKGSPSLRNSRSTQIVAGFEEPLGKGLDLRVEIYRRRFDRLLVQRLETDAERALRLWDYALPPDLPPDSALLEHRPTVFPESTGTGTASGVEMLVRRSGVKLNGWVSYAYTRTTREMYGDSFPFDFDRPHTVAAVGSYLLSSKLRLSATVLAASGFPVTPLHEEAYFQQPQNLDGTYEPIFRALRRQDGSLMMAPGATMRRMSLRNTDRLRGYSRVDIRVTYASLGHWEFYGEIINLFGTRNYRQDIDVPSPDGSEYFVTSNNIYENFERFPTFGVRFRF